MAIWPLHRRYFHDPETLSAIVRENPYRFWPFQFIETGIFVALAAVLIAVTFFVVRRRDA